jgi:hypothetical protein
MSRKIFKIYLVIIAIIFIAAFFATREMRLPQQTPQTQTKVDKPAPKKSGETPDHLLLDDRAKQASLAGKEIPDSPLAAEYGTYAFETLQKHPELIGQITALDSDFEKSKMDPSFPSKIYQTDDAKKYLVFGGCTAHDCAGTGIFAVFNTENKEMFIAKENEFQTELQFFGNPPAKEKDLLVYYYYHR